MDLPAMKQNLCNFALK